MNSDDPLSRYLDETFRHVPGLVPEAWIEESLQRPDTGGDPDGWLQATPALPEGVAPLAVWDVRAAEWPHGWTDGHVQQMEWWVQTRLTAYARDIYRIEFYLFDGPFAVVHPYALNDEGFRYLDIATGEAAVKSPVLVPLDELPPEHLLR